jgi:hypothetical protein
MSIDDEILNTEDRTLPLYPEALKELIRRLGRKHHIKMYGGSLPPTVAGLRNILQNDIDTDTDPGSIIYYIKLIFIELIDTLIDHEQRIQTLEGV